MAEILIPPHLRPGLAQLATQDDEAVSELCGLLESNPDVLTSRQAAFDHASKLTKLGEEGYAVVEAIIPLLYFKASTGRTTVELVKEVTARLTTGKKEEVKLSSSSVPTFQKNLGRILELSGLTVNAKALALATDYQRLFSDVKILSDIRPVFGDDVSTSPLGAVVLHTLRVGFSEDGEEREFFVTLDSKDLLELQTWVNRALLKDGSLKRFIEQTNLRKFDTSN